MVIKAAEDGGKLANTETVKATETDSSTTQCHRVDRYGGRDGMDRKWKLKTLWKCRSCDFYCEMADDLEENLRSPTHFAMFGNNPIPKLSTSTDFSLHLESREHKRNLQLYIWW